MCYLCTDPSQLLEFITGKAVAQKQKESDLSLKQRGESAVTLVTPTVCSSMQESDRILSTEPVQTTKDVTHTCAEVDSTLHVDSSSEQTIESSPFVELPKDNDSVPLDVNLDPLCVNPDPNPDPLSTYLEPLSDSQLAALLVPDKILLKYAIAMDIVRPTSLRSCCFTKAYGQYTVGTGSIVQHCLGEGDLAVAFEGYQKALKNGASGDGVE